MKLVSGQDEAALERSMHLERLGDIIQRLTAELLRIAAGAALRCEWDVGIENYSTEESRQRWRRDGTARREELRDSIQQAAMRVVAARLMGQKAQESRAKGALFEAVREFGLKAS
jgi:hypothetical protein